MPRCEPPLPTSGAHCVLVTYDRLANGNHGGPGPWGDEDAVFAMAVAIEA